MPKNQHENTKTHSAAGEPPDKRRKRIRIAIISVVLVVIIAGASVGGWMFSNAQAQPYREAAIRVGEVTYDMDYYINSLKAYFGKVSPGDLTDFTAFGDLEVEQFAGYVQQQIVKNEIMEKGSALLGTTIDRNAVEAELKKSGLPVTDEQYDIMLAKMLIEKQVPVMQQQAQVQAVLAATEEDAREAISRLQKGEPLEQVVKDLSKISETNISKGELGWVTAREADITTGSTKFGETVLNAPAGISSEPFYDDTVTKTYGYWLMKVVDKKEVTDSTTNKTSESVRVKGILVGSRQAAGDVINRLNAGEDMDELAKELSQLSTAKTIGAELGWITKGQQVGDLDAIFDLPIDGLSQPIGDDQAETKGGYWAYNILNKENRSLTGKQKSMLEEDLLKRVDEEVQKNPDFTVESFIDAEMMIFAIDEVVLAQGKGSVFITAASVPDGEATVPYSYQLGTYGEKKGNTWSITEGSLPKGLELDTETGLISGTPQFAGGSSFTLRVDNKYHFWEQEMFMRVRILVSVATESLPEAQVGVDYSEPLAAMGDGGDYTWSLVSGSLPDGLTLGKLTGNIWGKPTTTGTYEFTLKVEDGLGSGTKTLSITVVDAPPSDNTTAPSDSG